MDLDRSRPDRFGPDGARDPPSAAWRPNPSYHGALDHAARTPSPWVARVCASRIGARLPSCGRSQRPEEWPHPPWWNTSWPRRPPVRPRTITRLTGHRSGPPGGILERVGGIRLGGRAPAIAVATIVRVGVPHAVDHGPEDADARTVELAAGPLDLGEPAGVVPTASTAPSAHRPRIKASGTGRTGGESMMTRS